MVYWHKDCTIRDMQAGIRQVLKHTLMAAACGVALVSHPAAAYDALIEGAKQCTQYFPIKEREQGIPVHLLAAISSIETGRYHKGLGMALPWPWTINVEGKGYFFQTKAEAIAETRRHLNNGKQSIDVGCMQVNLKHHPDAFASLEEAFDPEKNVGYAAKFLRANYGQLGNSWVKAAAAYHSRTPSRGNPYLQKVAGAWQKIVTKVQQAQARSGGQVTPIETADAAQLSRAAAGPALAETAQTSTRASAQPMTKIASTHHVKVISVNGAGRQTVRDTSSHAQHAPVMVVTPASSVSTVASYAPSAGSPQATPVAMARNEPVAPKRVSVDNRGGESHIKRSPTFVFAN